MDATSIILLVGLVSFWGAIGLAAGFMIRFRKTMETLENTLRQVQSDLTQLSPVLSETLHEVEKTGQEMGHTAAEVRVLAQRVNAGSAPTIIGGTVSYLPAVIGVFRLIRPLFAGKGRKNG